MVYTIDITTNKYKKKTNENDNKIKTKAQLGVRWKHVTCRQHVVAVCT